MRLNRRRRPNRIVHVADWLLAGRGYRAAFAAFRHAWPRRETMEGNRVWLLRDGEAMFPALLKAIAGARHHVHIEMYIFEDDALGRRIRDALLGALARGVQVRIVYDSVGSGNTPERFWRELQAAGAETHAYHPLLRWPPSFSRINRRNHRKLVVVDGRIGFTGGMNLGDNYAPEAWGGDGWRDTGVRIMGPAVAEMQLFFLASWLRAERSIPSDPRRFFPHLSRRGGSIVVPRTNGTVLRRHGIRSGLLRAINAARERIWITHAYFIPDGGLRRALVRAVRRGVDVRVIVPMRSDVAVIHAAVMRAVRLLLASGIQVMQRTGPVLHAKTVVIDDHWSLVGSYNMNYRSFLHNLEVSVEVEDPVFGRAMANLFVQDQVRCEPLDEEAFAGMSLGERIRQELAWMVRYWL